MRAQARRTDPQTSHEAAAALKVPPVERTILNALLDHREGGTTEEITAWTTLGLVTVSPRLLPMERKGLVARVGTKENISGRKAIVWQAKEVEWL